MESMADEDFKFFTLNNTELKVFRDGRLQHLDKRSKSKVWKDKKLSNCNGYLNTYIYNKTYLVHNIIALCYLGIKPECKQTDHINSIKTDNRVENLQYITASENCMKKTNIKGKPIKGAYKTPSGNFRVRIKINGKNINYGSYDTEEEAIEIYIQAKAKLLIHIEVE
jgi:hypothetical protein